MQKLWVCQYVGQNQGVGGGGWGVTWKFPKLGLTHRSLSVGPINRELLFKTNTMLTDVNRLCRNVNAICVERDQVIEKLNELKITLGDFKRLTSYYVEEENIVRDNVMPPKERTVEIVPSFARAIPKIHVKDSCTTNFGQQLVNEAFQIISEDCNIREEEVSCQHEMSNGPKENEQYQQHEDVSTDGTHLPNESLQTMNGNTSTH